MKLHWNETAAAATGRLGYFEGLRDNCLAGWARDAAQPRQAARLRLSAPGAAPVTVFADRYRADVQKAGQGDGYCGFVVPAARFAPGAVIRCAWADDDLPLPGPMPSSPRPHTASGLQIGPWQLALDPPLRGDPRIGGHLLDPRRPGHRAQLGLYLGAVLLQRATACLYRPEARLPGGDGFNGFAFLPPRRGAVLDLVDLEQGMRLARVRR